MKYFLLNTLFFIYSVVSVSILVSVFGAIFYCCFNHSGYNFLIANFIAAFIVSLTQNLVFNFFRKHKVI